ncbi:MAG: hypothetical protein WC734_06340 [Patescibacteria group bacterium]|jgi:hypothetical protein
MAKKQTEYAPEILVEEPTVPATEGPMDYRRAVNLSNRPLMGLPLGDGTTISMSSGPFSKNDTHISRPFLNKFVGSYLKRLEKAGKIKLVPDRGDA